MKRMTMLFGPVFNQKLVQTMVGKYFKLVHENYNTNIGRYSNYENHGLIPEHEWVSLIGDANEKNTKKEGSLHPRVRGTPK